MIERREGCLVPWGYTPHDLITFASHFKDPDRKILNLQHCIKQDPDKKLFEVLRLGLPALQSLESLNVSHNSLQDEDVQAIFSVLKTAQPPLVSLNVGHNSMSNLGAAAFASAIGVMTSLTSLDLSGNALCGIKYGRGTYTAEGIKAIADALRVSASLTECNLRENELGVEGWTIVFNALRDSPTSKIATWDLSDERLGSAIAKPLAEYISVSASLTLLSLRENPLDEEGVIILCNALPNSRVQELDLSDTGTIGTEGLNAVADMIAVVSSLTSLSLGGTNEIGDEGATVIARALKDSQTCKLASLYLHCYDSGNQIGPAGARGLAGYISLSESLTILSIQDNILGDDGTILLCDALRESTVTKIEELNFFGSNIDCAGALAVGKMAAVVASLTKINLSWNFLGDRGVIALCDALTNSTVTNLQQLKVARNGIGEQGANALAQMVANVTSLNLLDVSQQENEDGGDSLSDAGKRQLQQARRPGLEIYV